MFDVEQSSQPTPVPISAGEAKCVFDKSAAPGASDDETEGFAANSVWYKATAPYALYICTDATAGFAVWREIPLNVGGVLIGGCRFLGYTTSSAAPSTTELPNDKNWCFHYDDNASIFYLAFNFGGVILKVELS